MAVSGVSLKISGDKLPNAQTIPVVSQRGMDRVLRLTEAMVRDAAPVRRGKLRDSIQSRMGFSGNILVGQVYTERFQARLVEYGVRPHAIRPRRKKILRWRTKISLATGKTRGVWSFARQVSHPGMPARPFMRPAGERALREAPAIFLDEFDSELTRG